MEPRYCKLLDLLSNNDVTFFIPPYQRNYEWTRDQCSVFLDDIIKTAINNQNGVDSEHFFGTLTYYEEKHVFGEPSELVLIDGQQRITTTMLFLIAVRECIDDEKIKSYIDNKFLLNTDSQTEKGEYKIKLKQVETDWESYRKLIINTKDESIDKTSYISQNYSYFLKELTENKEKYNLTKLISDGLGKFSIVTIQLQPELKKGENPQEIFESMNSLGKPLSLADLVRNYILLGFSSTEQEKNYKAYWLHMERVIPGRISDFIRDFMQAKDKKPYKIAQESNYKELYREFKSSSLEFSAVTTKAQYSTELLKELSEFSDLYASITSDVTTGSKVIDKVMQNIRSIKITTAYSFILVILNEWKHGTITENETADILDALFIYGMRRRIIGDTNFESKFFPVLAKKIDQLIKASDKKLEMFKIFSSQEEKARLPNDIEVGVQLKEMNFYAFSNCKFMLSLIEEHLTKERPRQDDKLLQIEHIMPRKLDKKDWLDVLGDDAEEKHKKYVNRLGNLTLIRHNQELGNKAFKEKKEVYENKAGLQIAKSKIIECDIWDIEAIEARGEWLKNLILDDIIPIPEEMKKLNNYSIKESRGLNFLELQMIGVTITFIKDPKITAKVVGKAEVEYNGKRTRLSPLTRELMEQRGEGNKSGAYQGAQYWEYEGLKLADMI